MKHLYALSLTLFFTLFAAHVLKAQPVDLSYVPGYCNRVEAVVSGYNAAPIHIISRTSRCRGSDRPIAGTRIYNVLFQLQILNPDGTWANDGDAKPVQGNSTVYRDLQYGETYRVKAFVNFGGAAVYNFFRPCGSPVGTSFGGTSTFNSNALDIEAAGDLDNSSLDGVFISPMNTGGDGSSFATRAEYCRSDVEDGILYDLSASHGADHWAVNIEQINDNSGNWAGGSWYDYLPAKLVGSEINIHEEGWFGKGWWVWPGQFTVTTVAYQDCDSAPWAEHIDYFEILDCRLDLEDQESIDVVLHPNPSPDGLVQFKTIGDNLEELQYVVFGTNGQQLQEGTLDTRSGQLDLSRLGAGMYLVQFQSAKRTITKRVVITE
ncbi:MAG: T9SS type A sorting domain-containing protein [Bacteroidota bacterium]